MAEVTKCKKCDKFFKSEFRVCPYCGEPFTGNCEDNSAASQPRTPPTVLNTKTQTTEPPRARVKQPTTLSELLDVVCGYFESKAWIKALMNISTLLLLIYPIYYVLRLFNEFHSVTIFIGKLANVILYVYYSGIVLCFVQRKFVQLSVAFGTLSIYFIIQMSRGFRTSSFDNVCIVLIYMALSICCIYFNSKYGKKMGRS